MHFALTAEQESRLLAASGDDEVMALVEEIEEAWGEHCETDKAWDAVHRCLTDGTLTGDDGPLAGAVLGGRWLHEADDYIVVYTTAAEVAETAAALAAVDRAWLHDRYQRLPDDYAGPHDAEDFAYTWSNLTDLRDFFTRSAAAARPVIFTVSQ